MVQDPFHYYIDGTRPVPLSMNELNTEYWNSYVIWNSFIYKYFIIQNIEIVGIKSKL